MQKNIRIIDCNRYKLTNQRVLCRRGVIWLGQTCNLRCYFCYFSDRVSSTAHPEHSFMSLDKAKKICRTLVDYYGNSSIDIQGGEPTIYPYIYDLIVYCNSIGLKPTLITNAVALHDMERCKRLKEANVFDLLISIHGLEEVYDRVVGVKGASVKQMKAIDNCIELDIPFRINITLTKEALSQLDPIIRVAVRKAARAVNFIAFNPFIDQSKDKKRNIEDIPLYKETASLLIPVIDYLESNNIEVNVRYLPFCVFPEQYRKYVQNFQQIIYDIHEWESAGEVWSSAPPQRRAHDKLSEPNNFLRCVNERRNTYLTKIKNEKHISIPGIANNIISCMKPKVKGLLEKNHPKLFNMAIKFESDYLRKITNPRGSKAVSEKYEKKFYLNELGEIEGFTDMEYAYKEFRVLMPKMVHPYIKSDKCDECDITGICDGFHRDYALLIGFHEIQPVHIGSKIYDPRYYMFDQMKVVEEQEFDWALPLDY